MPDDLTRLETLAKRATQGPWSYEAGEVVAGEVAIADFTWNPTDGEFLAAADPLTVLALVAELRAARKVVKEAKLAASPTPWLRDVLAAYDEARHA